MEIDTPQKARITLFRNHFPMIPVVFASCVARSNFLPFGLLTLDPSVIIVWIYSNSTSIPPYPSVLVRGHGSRATPLCPPYLPIPKIITLTPLLQWVWEWGEDSKKISQKSDSGPMAYRGLSKLGSVPRRPKVWQWWVWFLLPRSYPSSQDLHPFLSS